ncbi:MAG: LysR family transcriptional regulator [Bacteroidales bacterium]
MNTKPQKLHLRYKFWIETDTSVSVLGEGKWQLLKAIRETGSLKAAVEKMGYSYRQTWQNLKNIEERLGFKLIEKQRGGKTGGKTVLTSKGEKIVQFFDRLYKDIEPELLEQFDKMMDDLNKIIE